MRRGSALFRRAKPRPGRKRTSRKRALAFALVVTLFGVALEPSVGQAAPTTDSVLVEVDLAAEQSVDPAMIRRFIALELGGLEVPPPPGTLEGTAAPLFFRVLGGEGTELSIELWELGAFWGSRTLETVSSDRRLNARRVALGAADLARRLQRARVVEVRLWQRAEEAERRARLVRTERSLGARPVVLASAQGAVVGNGELLLAGPSLGGRIGFGGLRAGLNVSWLGARVAQEPEASSGRWFELSFAPAYAVALGPRSELVWGASIGWAFVHLDGFSAVDAIAGQADSWSGRAALDLRYEWQGGALWGLQVGPSVGASLRPIPVTSGDGAAERIGGIWLGAALSLVVAPNSTPRPEPMTLAEHEL